MRKILILLLFSTGVFAQQISVQGDEIKYRTTNGIKTAVNTDTLASRLTFKVDKIAGKGLSTNDYSNAAVTTLSTNTSNLLLLQADRNALFDSVSNKVNKVVGKGLSTNDYTTTEKNKLTGIATGATVNATDAALRDRTTHTGVQAISTVSGLQTALDGKFATPTGLTTDFFQYWNGTGYTNSTIRRNATGVGIGVTPAQTLHVNGNTATTKLLVNTVVEAGFQADVNGSMRVSGLFNEITVGRGGGNVSSNTAVGANALLSNTTGFNNTANGQNALSSNTTGFSNTANGRNALSSNTTGDSNTASGVNSLFTNTTGVNNTASGVNSLLSNTTGVNNTASGVTSLFANTTGSFNTAFGTNAGRYIANGSTSNTNSTNSIFLGAETRALADNQTNQVVIGGSGGTGLGSNTTVLGNASTVTTGLWGDIRLVKGMATAPASATAAGVVGDIRVTATHIYVCTATNTWVRAALATW